MKGNHLWLGFAALLGSFALLAVVVGSQPSSFDVLVANLIGAGPAAKGTAAAALWGDFTALGGGPVVVLLVALVVGYLLVARHPKTALVVAGCTIASSVSGQIFKHLFERPRPDHVHALMTLESYSFPSGHSLISAAVYPILGALLAGVVDGKRLKIYSMSVGLLMMVLIGVSRIYLGVHYATDVLAGWCLGLSWALLSWEVLRRLQREGLVEDDPILEDELNQAPRSK